MHFSWDWLGPASSIATVAALIVTLLYYLYRWPFNLKKPEGLVATQDNDRVKLHWTPVHRASHYNIYRTNTKSGVVDVYSCTTHHHADASLVPGETYQYYAVAEDQGHQSPQSDAVSIEVKAIAPTSLAGLGTGISPPPVAPADGSPEAQWPVKDLRQLYAELHKKDNKTVLAILEMTAAKPDTLVPYSEICQSADVTGRQGGTAIGGLTRLITSLGKTKWPFTHHPTQSGQYYKLSLIMAERWRQAEAEEANH